MSGEAEEGAVGLFVHAVVRGSLTLSRVQTVVSCSSIVRGLVRLPPTRLPVVPVLPVVPPVRRPMVVLWGNRVGLKLGSPRSGVIFLFFISWWVAWLNTSAGTGTTLLSSSATGGV